MDSDSRCLKRSSGGSSDEGGYSPVRCDGVRVSTALVHEPNDDDDGCGGVLTTTMMMITTTGGGGVLMMMIIIKRIQMAHRNVFGGPAAPAPRRPLSVTGVLRRRCPGVPGCDEAGVPARLPLPKPRANSRLPNSGLACRLTLPLPSPPPVSTLLCFGSLLSDSPSVPSIRAPMKPPAVCVSSNFAVLRGDRERIPARTDGFKLWLRPDPGRPPRDCPGVKPARGDPSGDRGVTHVSRAELIFASDTSILLRANGATG